MSKAIAAIFALLVLMGAGVFVTQAALEDAGDDVSITNESFTPTAGTVTDLDDSKITGAYYEHNVSVYDENGTPMDYGDDYIWFAGNGTVKPLSGNGLDGDASASITYGYSRTTKAQRDIAGLVGMLPRVLGLVAPVFVAVIAFRMMGAG